MARAEKGRGQRQDIEGAEQKQYRERAEKDIGRTGRVERGQRKDRGLREDKGWAEEGL